MTMNGRNDMFLQHSESLFVRLAIAGAVSLGALSLAGCDAAGPEEGVDVPGVTDDGVEVDVEDITEDGPSPEPYDGPYDEDWYAE